MFGGLEFDCLDWSLGLNLRFGFGFRFEEKFGFRFEVEFGFVLRFWVWFCIYVCV